MSVLVDPYVAAATVVELAVRPPPPSDLNRWAEDNIVITESSVPGPYRRTTIPPAERILECLGPEHPARTVSIVSSVQFFKTTIGMIFVGGSTAIDPCDMGYVLPTHDQAIRWSRTKWKKIRRDSTALTKIFGPVNEGSRDKTDTVLYQETKDGRGSLQISGANSEASLTMMSWRRQVQDDLSKWEHNEGGDPENQAEGRSSSFDWAKILKISPPKLAKTCRITRAFKAGTQEHWHVPCPHCEHKQPLTWENFLANLDRNRPEKACFNCVSCGGLIEHKHKREIVAKGEWVAENPGAKDPSFHIWRAYSPFRDWESIVREWLSVEGNLTNDDKGEQVFFNEVLGLAYDVANEAPPWENIRDRANRPDDGYDRGRIPAGALLIIISVDCQGNRTECHIKGFGEGLRRWTIDYQVIPHHISTDDCRVELNKLLQSKWPDEYKNLRGTDMLAIDGNAYTNDVFGWAKHHSWNRVIIVRGANSEHAVPLKLANEEHKPTGKLRKPSRRFYNVGVSGLKSSFYEHLKKIDPQARGYCGYPHGMDDEFYRQMTAETRKISNDKWGYPRAHWEMWHTNNEVLDTEMYAEAAAIRCGWYSRTPEQWAALRADREKEKEPGQNDMFDPANTPPLVSNAAHQAAPQEPKKSVIGELSKLLNKK